MSRRRRHMTDGELHELRARKADRWIRPPGHSTAQARRAAVRPRSPSETAECKTYIGWSKLVTFLGTPLYDRVVKVANERGKPGPMTAILASIGMRKGFPDYVIFAPFGQFHGLILEAKRTTDATIDEDQVAWRDRLMDWGYHAEICSGAVQLVERTKQYMELSGATAAGAFVCRARIAA